MHHETYSEEVEVPCVWGAPRKSRRGGRRDAFLIDEGKSTVYWGARVSPFSSCFALLWVPGAAAGGGGGGGGGGVAAAVGKPFPLHCHLLGNFLSSLLCV